MLAVSHATLSRKEAVLEYGLWIEPMSRIRLAMWAGHGFEEGVPELLRFVELLVL